ncbi:AAA family ATPase [Staphylococcus aureus]|uniref:AAA family ATPase n=2 Tax=Staphylococcus aureus TaxID=1280 RepID=UPI0005C544E9|nr:AAA family ATPase [Staphylococcus aureus]MCO4456398.1 hypothetical protein [Staphylococcus aureus]UUR09721.1 AAA family ATPase [Staphylococcus aureus subsp. aureus JKD6159]
MIKKISLQNIATYRNYVEIKPKKINFIYGSHESTSVTSNKIVIIDDPISSLDSNVLFIVSTLVKNLINDCRNNKNGIQQIFNLTHNIYFHKEITF